MSAKRHNQDWTPEVHEDILFALLDHIKPGTSDWAKIMQNLGRKYKFTEGALK